MIKLTYLSNIIALPTPEFGETAQVDVKTTFDHSMDGAIYSFRSTSADTKMALPLKGLHWNKAVDLIEFVKLAAGHVVVYTNQNNVDANVRLIDESLAFKNGGSNLYDITINIEKE